jgi:hypothetical protein
VNIERFLQSPSEGKDQRVERALLIFNLVLGRFFPSGEGRKDPGRRWSRDVLKSSRFLISNPR